MVFEAQPLPAFLRKGLRVSLAFDSPRGQT